MWPFRVLMSTWRRNNPEKAWEKALEDVLQQNTAQVNKAVENTIERLKILTSGHENCPVRKMLNNWWCGGQCRLEIIPLLEVVSGIVRFLVTGLVQVH